MYAAGLDEKEQMVFMGHASKSVTDVYRKMSEAAFQRALLQLNEYYATIDFTVKGCRKNQMCRKCANLKIKTP
jgi:hypothetical protein